MSTTLTTSAGTTGSPGALTGPVRLRAAALALAGASFALYPMLRGSGSESGLAGAELYARPAWLAGHVLGMVGFVAAAWGIAAVDRRAARWTLAGTVLLLPFYGAEAYGLHAIGRRAVETDDPALVAAADMFRYEPVAVTTFAIGLLAVAVGGVLLLGLLRTGLSGHRLGLLLTGLALATYVPQYFVPIGGRIGHGVVLGVGLLALSSSVLAGRARR